MNRNNDSVLRCSICNAPISTLYNFAMPNNGVNSFECAVCGECNLKYIATGIIPSKYNIKSSVSPVKS